MLVRNTPEKGNPYFPQSQKPPCPVDAQAGASGKVGASPPISPRRSRSEWAWRLRIPRFLQPRAADMVYTWGLEEAPLNKYFKAYAYTIQV